MHNEMSDGPQRPEPSGSTLGELTDATPPIPTCLSDEERNEIGEAVLGITAAITSSSQTLFERAMDNLVDLGAHKVGHAIQGMLWSGFQTAMIRSGRKPADMGNTMVVMAVEVETEADAAINEMATEFTRATFAGAHASGMDTWASWVDEVSDDWTHYCKGVALLVGAALYIATSDIVYDEEMSEVMGQKVARVVNRHADNED